MAINVSDLPPKYQAQAMKSTWSNKSGGGHHLPPHSRRIRKKHEIPQHPHRAGDSLRGRPAF